MTSARETYTRPLNRRVVRRPRFTSSHIACRETPRARAASPLDIHSSVFKVSGCSDSVAILGGLLRNAMIFRNEDKSNVNGVAIFEKFAHWAAIMPTQRSCCCRNVYLPACYNPPVFMKTLKL